MNDFFRKLWMCIKNNDYSRIQSYFFRRFALLGRTVRRWSRGRAKTVATDPLKCSQSLLTVFVLCKGTQASIDLTIKSLLRQTINGFEVVLCLLPDQASANLFDFDSFKRADVAFRAEITENQSLWNKMSARGKYVCCLHAGSSVCPTYLEKAIFLLETYCYDVVIARSSGEVVSEYIVLPTVTSFFNIAATYEKAVGKKVVWCSVFSAYTALCKGYLRRFIFFKYADKIGGLLQKIARHHEQPGNATGPTLLLCSGIITNGGGDRLTSCVTRYLSQKGWRIIVITTHDLGACESIPVQWFADFSDEVFLLHTFLRDYEERADFIKYLLQNRSVDVLLQVGSSHVYDLMPQLRKIRPELSIVDLLFNVVGHTQSNQKYSHIIDNTIVENSEVKSYLLSNGREQSKVTLISSGVFVPAVSDGEVAELRRTMQIEEDATIFGYAGRLSSEKNPQGFVELACRCRDMPKVHFVMTGAGPLGYEIENMLRQKPLKNFHYCGLVPNVFLYMHLYDMLVLPSLFDGRPLAIMEAMHCGTPCLASAVGGIPELIDNGVTGIVVPKGNDDMFEIMVRHYASLPDEMARLGRSAKEFANNNLCMDTMLKSYESVLNSKHATIQ